MIYALIKLPIRLALWIFCVDIELINAQYRIRKGPLLLVANHPNSFLDAIIIAAQFKRSVHFLARGDAFRKPGHRYLLGLLNMVPVYRLSEGRGNLHLNDYAFKKSQELLAEDKIVLIFIEGICLNRHELQPFKKGAARIAITAFREKTHLQVMPIAISYNDFTQVGKKIRVEMSEPIPVKTLLLNMQEPLIMQHFNHEIYTRLKSMIKKPEPKQPKKNKIWILFSLIGNFLHRPLYGLIKQYVLQKTKGTVFYDSVLFALLLIIYPLYLFFLFFLLTILHLQVYLIATVIIMHPLTAWYAVRYKIKLQTSS